MDTRTGRIDELEKFEDKENLTLLTPNELSFVEGIAPADRALHLAIYRFKQVRKTLGGKYDSWIESAFIQGYRQAVQDLK